MKNGNTEKPTIVTGKNEPEEIKPIKFKRYRWVDVPDCPDLPVYSGSSSTQTEHKETGIRKQPLRNK